MQVTKNFSLLTLVRTRYLATLLIHQISQINLTVFRRCNRFVCIHICADDGWPKQQARCVTTRYALFALCFFFEAICI